MERISAETIFNYNIPILDVRSPSEYEHAHIPGACSLPLFSDEERAIVGKTYKQIGKQSAIKTGLGFFKTNDIIAKAESIIKMTDGSQNSPEVIINCWRGGMRSEAVGWLLNLYGFKVKIIEGGYKAFRNFVLSKFTIDYPFNIVGGFTGSNKTGILQELKKEGSQMIDIEGLACHKGSAFGALGQPTQPSQEMFENLLAKELIFLNNNEPVFIEDESQRVGTINIPNELWQSLITKPVYFLEIPFEERLNFLLQEYGIFDKESLATSIKRIQKRLGPLETKTALQYLEENNTKACFEILLNYYDKVYLKALHKKDLGNGMVKKLSFSKVNAPELAKELVKNLNTESLFNNHG